MALTDIKPSHYNLIVQRIYDGRCVPFLGAGVNSSSQGYQGLPLAYEVSLRLVKTLTKFNEKQLEELAQKAADDVRRRVAQVVAKLDDEQIRQLSDASIEQYLRQADPLPSLLKASLPDLSRIALHVEVEQDFNHLLELVHEILPDTQYQPSPLLQILASMPFKLFVTTNYDRLLERALLNNDYELVVQPVSGFDEQEQFKIQDRLADPRGPIIYKIHGSFHDDNGSAVGLPPEMKRLILTEEDYIQFLSVVGRQDLGVPPLITEKLVNGTILFMGYSLQDWDFRTIHKLLFDPLHATQKPRSFAIQKDPPDFWVQYWHKKDVTVLNVDLYTFAQELNEYWQNFLAEKGETNGN